MNWGVSYCPILICQFCYSCWLSSRSSLNPFSEIFQFGNPIQELVVNFATTSISPPRRTWRRGRQADDTKAHTARAWICSIAFDLFLPTVNTAKLNPLSSTWAVSICLAWSAAWSGSTTFRYMSPIRRNDYRLQLFVHIRHRKRELTHRVIKAEGDHCIQLSSLDRITTFVGGVEGVVGST